MKDLEIAKGKANNPLDKWAHNEKKAKQKPNIDTTSDPSDCQNYKNGQLMKLGNQTFSHTAGERKTLVWREVW